MYIYIYKKECNIIEQLWSPINIVTWSDFIKWMIEEQSTKVGGICVCHLNENELLVTTGRGRGRGRGSPLKLIDGHIYGPLPSPPLSSPPYVSSYQSTESFGPANGRLSLIATKSAFLILLLFLNKQSCFWIQSFKKKKKSIFT